MKTHLSEDQLISYVYRTLADAQRETMDIHLRTCQDCWVRLAGHEALGRRVRYSVMDWQREISPPSQMTFAAVAPRLKRSRGFATFWTGSRQFVGNVAILAVLAVLMIGLAVYFREMGQSVGGRTSDGATFMGGPQRTGFYNTQGPKTGELRWQFATQGEIWAAPAVVDGVAYVGSQDGFLYAVDSQTGREKWKFDTGLPVMSTPAVADGTVYFGSGCVGLIQSCRVDSFESPRSNSYFYALDRQTGQEKWRFETGGGVASSPLIADGLVYFGSADQYFYAVDSQTGLEKWRFETTNDIFGSPALADGIVYFGTGCIDCLSNEDNNLYALDSRTGQEVWRFKTGSYVESTPAVADGVVYIGSGDGYVYAVDSQNGQEMWRFKTEGPVQGALAVGAGVVYAGSRDTYLYAINGQTGQAIWKFKAEDFVVSAAVIADGVVYFGSTDNYLYAVDSQTGQAIWKFKTGGSVARTSAAVIADGMVYFGSEDMNLYAVGDPQQ